MLKSPEDRRRLLLVVGSGRSGTSLTAGLLRRAGWRVPTPEVPANASNSRGFSEPQWLVDFQEGLLERHGLDNQDPRPGAWAVADRLSASARPRRLLRAWLSKQTSESAHVVLKDPRSGWFLEMHRAVSRELGIDLEICIVLRPPSQSLASRQLAYGVGVGNASLCAAWLNMMLEVEHRTRDLPRVFLRYQDVMQDWRTAFRAGSAVLGAPLIPDDEQADEESFVDPALARAEPGWEGLDVPDELARMCDRAFEALSQLVDGPREEAMVLLDELRLAYDRYYEGCRAVAVREINTAEQRHLRLPRLVKHGGQRSWRRLRG